MIKMFNLSAFAKHHERVSIAQTALLQAPADNTFTYFAKSWLDTLASPNGNDILEAVLVEATGRTPKQNEKKHGADSEDGELESKPFKCKYNAHISDDTPASLLRHHSIPYICLGQASKDGRIIYWALYTCYRIFDNARYRGIVNTLPLTDQTLFGETLPMTIVERCTVLENLKKVLGPKKYVRSNPLPLQAIKALKTGEFSLWVNPTVNSELIDPTIRYLAGAFPTSTLSAEYMQPYLAMREYCLAKKTDPLLSTFIQTLV